MSTQFTRALLRSPGRSYADGLTTSHEGAPDVDLAIAQHAAYAAALSALGLELRILPADEAYPDGVFVEDAAITLPDAALITRPGAPSRRGETARIAEALAQTPGSIARIEAPACLDGGDVCETDDIVLIGLTERTNQAGAERLGRFLEDHGRRWETLDIRGTPGLLHLKTGIAYLGEGRLALAPGLPDFPAFRRFEPVVLDPEEAYAANCVRVNARVLVAAGYPRFADALSRLGYEPLALDMSEFRKMDGGLSCLSLRF